jgi:hypothetical protein
MTPGQVRLISIFGLFYAFVVLAFWYILQPAWCVFTNEQLLPCPLPPLSGFTLFSSFFVALISLIGLFYSCRKGSTTKSAPTHL